MAKQFKKNGRAKFGRRRGTRRVADLRGVRQGQVSLPGQPYGGAVGVDPLRGLDALDYQHLPLPRAVGPYSVIRSSEIVDFSAFTSPLPAVALFGVTSEYASSTNFWSNVCCIASVDAALNMNAVNNAQTYALDNLTGSGWNQCRLCPAAISIQVMNPESLQTTQGSVYIGRLRSKPELKDSGRTWNSFASDFVAYNAPRNCAAAKLALRGVKIDGVPYNMSELSNFNPVVTFPNANYAWNGSASTAPLRDNLDFGGFGPIVIYNPNALSLQVVVTVEWRVRFDPSNPAQAGHVQHPVSSDITWGRALTAMEAMGHGVHDIVETVQRYGMAAGRIARGVQALRGPPQLMLAA